MANNKKYSISWVPKINLEIPSEMMLKAISENMPGIEFPKTKYINIGENRRRIRIQREDGVEEEILLNIVVNVPFGDKVLTLIRCGYHKETNTLFVSNVVQK